MMRSLIHLSFVVAATSAFSPATFISHHRSQTTWALHASSLPSLDDSNYQEIMKHKGTVLVDCCAQWCGPCKLIEPFLHQAADEFADLQVVKYDVEGKQSSGIKVEFLLQGVLPKALPSLILFQNGKAVANHVGALTQDELNEFIAAHIGNSKGHDHQQEDRELVAAGRAPEKTAGFAGISMGGAGDRDDYML